MRITRIIINTIRAIRFLSEMSIKNLFRVNSYIILKNKVVIVVTQVVTVV